MRYEAPDSLEGAVALLAGAQGEARVLAGGADLLVQMRADVLDPDLIVDIKKIKETRAVTEEEGGWRIGADVDGTEMDIAVVGAGVSLPVDGAGLVTAARVSLGAVAARVLLVAEAAQAIVGSRLDAPAQERLEAAARAACRPIDDKRGTVEFRIQA